jgi:hypothetical protein
VAAGAALFSAGAGAQASSTAGHRAVGPPPLALPTCPAGSLSATYTMVPGSNATGHVEYMLTVTNTGAVTCAVPAPLSGTLVGANGQSLPTNAGFSPATSYRVPLASGQWAQADSQLSPDLAATGEPSRGNCEPPAHALRLTVGFGSVTAPMDPTPVCDYGAILFERLGAVPVTTLCSPSALTAGFRRQFRPFDGFATYLLTLRNRSAAACHVNSVLALRLLSARGRRLRTRVQSAVSSPYTIPSGQTETAAARVATRGGRCDTQASELTVTVAPGVSTRSAIAPPVRACRSGLINLTSLYLNG